MSDFKFKCPQCGQKILVDAASAGRQLDCPACNSKLTIPSPPQRPGAVASATMATGKGARPPTKPAPATPARPAETPSAKTQATASAPPKPTSPKPAPGSDRPKVAAPKVPTASVPPPKAEHPPTSKAGPIKIPKAALPQPGEATPVSKVAPPPEAPARPPQQEPSASSPTPSSPAVKPATAGQPVQVAKLTPAIKRDIIRAVRRRLADESRWMPRLTPEGEYAYAAKEVDGKPVSVPVTSPEATRFSILGALLLEMDVRNVIRTAEGRQELLDEELVAALREVVGEEADKPETAPGELPSSGKQVPAVSHSQCLKALDVMEKRYANQMEETVTKAQTKVEEVRLSDLLRKLERNKQITTQELVRALANELGTIEERLDALERSPGKGR